MSFSFAAYGVYLLGLRRATVRPNRASWLIWSASAAAEALTYAAVNPGSPQGWVFILSAACCLIVTACLWRGSNWAPPTSIEAFCMAACLSALLIWVAFREAYWAHMLVVAAVPVSFWPTWVSVWKDRSSERSPAWGLWTSAISPRCWSRRVPADLGQTSSPISSSNSPAMPASGS